MTFSDLFIYSILFFVPELYKQDANKEEFSGFCVKPFQFSRDVKDL